MPGRSLPACTVYASTTCHSIDHYQPVPHSLRPKAVLGFCTVVPFTPRQPSLPYIPAPSPPWAFVSCLVHSRPGLDLLLFPPAFLCHPFVCTSGARASSLLGKFLMSPRITRSSARQAASQAAQAPPAAPSASAATVPEPSSPTAPTPSLSRKRKVSSAEKSPATGPPPSSSVRRSKRQKIPEAAVPSVDTPSHTSSPRKGRAPVDMDGAELVKRPMIVGNCANPCASRVPALPTTMETPSGPSRRSTRSKRNSSQSQGLPLVSRSYAIFLWDTDTDCSKPPSPPCPPAAIRNSSRGMRLTRMLP